MKFSVLNRDVELQWKQVSIAFYTVISFVAIMFIISFILPPLSNFIIGSKFLIQIYLVLAVGLISKLLKYELKTNDLVSISILFGLFYTFNALLSLFLSLDPAELVNDLLFIPLAVFNLFSLLYLYLNFDKMAIKEPATWAVIWYTIGNLVLSFIAVFEDLKELDTVGWGFILFTASLLQSSIVGITDLVYLFAALFLITKLKDISLLYKIGAVITISIILLFLTQFLAYWDLIFHLILILAAYLFSKPQYRNYLYSKLNLV